MKFRTLLLGLSALFVAFNAAFFSVSGLSKLFAGASFSVMLMASSLELAKLITAGYLYNYWSKINAAFRVYLTIGVVILVLITSLGIYGFLTAAFQDTFNVFSRTEKQRSFLEQKESFWKDDVARYDEELERISTNISTLSNAKTTSIQVRDTSVVGGVRNTISTAELRLAQKRIGVEEQNRKEVQAKREVAADSLQSIQLRILELDTDTEIGSELGPLQYLSGLLDRPMDEIINWFILIIIFVFDPLAVALVVAFNNAIKIDKGEKDKKKVVEKRELYGEQVEDGTTPKGVNLTELEQEIDNLLESNPKEDELEDKDWKASHWEELEADPNDLADIDLFDGEPQKSEPAVVQDPTNIEVIEPEVVEPPKANLDLDGDGTVSKDEMEADADGDGEISEEEFQKWYDDGGWRQPYNGGGYWMHPKFDWSKRERWINNQSAIKYWVNNRGGSYTKVNQYKSDYPDDFTSKTY